MKGCATAGAIPKVIGPARAPVYHPSPIVKLITNAISNIPAEALLFFFMPAHSIRPSTIGPIIATLTVTDGVNNEKRRTITVAPIARP